MSAGSYSRDNGTTFNHDCQLTQKIRSQITSQRLSTVIDSETDFSWMHRRRVVDLSNSRCRVLISPCHMYKQRNDKLRACVCDTKTWLPTHTHTHTYIHIIMISWFYHFYQRAKYIRETMWFDLEFFFPFSTPLERTAEGEKMNERTWKKERYRRIHDHTWATNLKCPRAQTWSFRVRKIVF